MNKIYINDNWKFSEHFEMDMLLADYDEQSMQTVRLPHTVKETPFHYFDESVYQMESGYRRSFVASQEWKDKRVFLVLEAAGHQATVYLNGAKLATHSCGYTSFRVELTDALSFDHENVITICCDSRENLNIPPFGHVVDYMTYGGLYREAYIEIHEKDYIEDVYGVSKLKLEDTKATFQSQVTINIGSEKLLDGETNFSETCDGELWDIPGYAIRQTLLTENGDEVATFAKNELLHTVSQITPWGINHPVRYILHTELFKDDTLLEMREDVIAFRTTEFREDGFYLNGEKVKIRGLNRHQSYPYVGYAMPESMQRRDADILKYELGCNTVRTSHYPQSHDFVDECDKIGLLVFMEFPGWQHIGDEEWKAQALINEEEMILQYRNHPSIMIWGIRINESADDDAFYEKTNALAHELDSMRQTGGVRAMQKSHLLEDVYTYNDFLHDGTNPGCNPKKKVTSDMKKGYLITEYNGHMYPTKAYDWEEHRLQHALRHANVLDAVAGQKDISGCIGWCMFDYNTHKDFGSGDRICYHGVMDMFRNPKPAALVYSSCQSDEPILELSSTMDIGEHPGCNRGSTYIFTNADSVRMYKNDVFIKEYTKKQSPYKNLEHGPILIDDFIGDEIHKNENFKKHQADIIKEAMNYVTLHGYHFPPRIILIALECMLFYHMKPIQAVQLYNKYIGDWGGETKGYRFEAVKDGKVVKTIRKQPMKSCHLVAEADHTDLADLRTYDVSEIRLKMVDENDNLLYFYNDPVSITTEGPIALIGPTVLGLQGGMSGLYVKTTGESGVARVSIASNDAEPVTIEFKISNGGKDGRQI